MIDSKIKYLLTDSRSLSFPSETAFFALVTARNDGHRYIRQLYDRGVRSFYVQAGHYNASLFPEAQFIEVPDTLRALQQVASDHRAEFQIPIIGITGSNGKTIVKEWLFQLLRQEYDISRSPRSYNSQIGVPLSVWLINQQTSLAIIEAGISRPHEMEHLQPIVRPTIGIFTNLGDAHQENFLSPEQKVKEKLRLFKGAEVLIYCSDDPIVHQTIQESKRQLDVYIKTLTWGHDQTADIVVRTTEHLDTHTRIEYTYQGHHGHYSIPFSDQAAINDSLHCLAVMLHLGYTHDEIGVRMQQLQPVRMRLDVKQGIRGCRIINDAYNYDMTSLLVSLDFLDQQAAALHMPRTVILSENIRHSEVEQMLQNRRIEQVLWVSDTTTFLHSQDFKQLRDSVILLKGSRRYQFERISHELEQIQHETVLEINLSRLIRNMNYFRSRLRPTTRLCCMVKAFAYGSGSLEVSRALQNNGVDYLAVAVADEGAELRREGIHLPMIVMAPEIDALDSILEHHLEPNIHNMRILKAFIEAARRQGLNNYPVHIKIDSGMHRLGFEEQMLPELLDMLNQQHTVQVKSVFSHLAGADEHQFDDFTRDQIQYFTRCADQLQQGLPYPVLRHILNSAGIERFTDSQFDMCRLGIGLYGMSVLPDTHLEPVCTLKTVLLQIKTIRAGESIGYGRNTRLTSDRQIAVAPIGYADGFDRRLGNRGGEVVVNGHRCPVMGNVCMDQIMIDVTDADAHVGDSVEIFGDQLPIEELAQRLGTITYEILTGISRRVNRVYFQE